MYPGSNLKEILLKLFFFKYFYCFSLFQMTNFSLNYFRYCREKVGKNKFMEGEIHKTNHMWVGDFLKTNRSMSLN